MPNRQMVNTISVLGNTIKTIADIFIFLVFPIPIIRILILVHFLYHILALACNKSILSRAILFKIFMIVTMIFDAIVIFVLMFTLQKGNTVLLYLPFIFFIIYFDFNFVFIKDKVVKIMLIVYICISTILIFLAYKNFNILFYTIIFILFSLCISSNIIFYKLIPDHKEEHHE
jgi:hypothetical protein